MNNIEKFSIYLILNVDKLRATSSGDKRYNVDIIKKTDFESRSILSLLSKIPQWLLLDTLIAKGLKKTDRLR